MSLDALTLTIAGRLVTRRWRRNTERGIRHDDAILRWPAKLRATPADLTPPADTAHSEATR